ncbi:Cytochrome c1 2 [Abeliophyllum distichum]|uniref:Cytochrome c1 2 n=1 Tax=Abeliophyllum distichum TaxID=126358 RepID=A0ABD1RYS9_9LAMI
MRFGKVSRFIDQLIRQSVVNRAASDFKAAPLLPALLSKHGQDESRSTGMKSLKVFALLGAGASGLLNCATVAYSDEAEHGLECSNYPWPHEGILSSYDHASIRRGSPGLPASLCILPLNVSCFVSRPSWCGLH